MRSMTGYGSAEGPVGHGWLFIELRTVNHRYCDIQLKIPPKFNLLDPRIRKLVQSRVARGKVDIFFKERRDIEPPPKLTVNLPLAKAYQRCLKQLETVSPTPPPHLVHAVPLRDLIVVEEAHVHYEGLWRQIAPLMQAALRKLERMRAKEGVHLQRDQIRCLSRLHQLTKRIEKLAHAMAAEQMRANSPTEEAPLGGEGATQAPVIDIHEELTRLTSHLAQYRTYAKVPTPVGRQLDFLIQEINREINTIGSKGNSAAISQLVVEAKTTLEKLREQVQNIE